MRYIVNEENIKDVLKNGGGDSDCYMCDPCTKETKPFKTDKLVRPYGINVLKNIFLLDYKTIINNIDIVDLTITVTVKQDTPVSDINRIITFADRCGWNTATYSCDNKLMFRRRER